MQIAGLEVEENYKPEWLGRSELDIYLPALHLGIEYDGQAWHKSGKKDIHKDLLCLSNGIGLIRIREPKCPRIIGVGPCYILPDTKAESLNAAIEFIYETLRKEYSVSVSTEININVATDRIKIYELMELRDKENSLGMLQPQLAKEWNYDRNGSLTLDMVFEKSNKKVWWKCPICGHEWDAVIASRVAGNGCPECGKKQAALLRSTPILSASFQEINPAACAEWDYERNGSLTPADVFPFSHQKVWWHCAKGHQWQATIADRSSGKTCPYCNGVYPIAGETDLATLFPEIAAEWHPTKNEDLTPSKVLPGSSQKVWWSCAKGHEWETTIFNRTGKNHTGCPICSGKAVLSSFNDLATTNPTLAKEWNVVKNGSLTCKDVTVGSNKKVWWICRLGHEWQAIINSRRNGGGCPYCANKILLKGFNDLATTHPDIAAQWHPTLNDTLTASDVFAGTAQKIWWQCKKGHEWQTTVNSRTTNGTGCPYCSGQKVIAGESDLQTLHPEIASEWDFESNAPLSPTEFKPKSNKKVWWICSHCGGHFKKKIVQRVLFPICPYCGHKKP